MNTPPTHARVLIVDDNPDDRLLVRRELTRAFPDLEILEALNEAALRHLLAHEPIDLVITDYQLQWSDGLTVLRLAKECSHDCLVIMFTGSGNQEIAVQAMKLGLDDYLVKSPSHYPRIPSAVSAAFGRREDRVAKREAEENLRRALAEKDVLLEELLRSNEDLQQFAFAASHDLQEPLRTISLYAQLLEREVGNELEPDKRQIIGRIIESANKMMNLVAGLLHYGRILHTGDRFETIPASELVNAAVNHLHNYVAEKKARVEFGPLPEITADRHQMIAVFQNLISNAIKYYEGPDFPRVHISADQNGANNTFCVADNGIGIPPAHHAKVFNVFTRLHPKTYPGTGIGLAIVKRIIERHHGRIWIESEEGQGTRFRFKLPAAEVA